MVAGLETEGVTGQMAESQHETDEEWFPVLEGPWYRDDNDQPDEDPEMFGVPAAFVRELRQQAPAWQALGIIADHTVGCYENERLRVGIDIVDAQANVNVAALRVDITDKEWAAGWVGAAYGLVDPDFAEVNPQDRTGGPVTNPEGTAAIAQAIEWLQAQLRRPLVRYVWREGNEVVGEDWRLTDTGRSLIGSGDPALAEDPGSADEATQLRP